MKKAQVKRCPHCNAKMVEYRHTINKNMVACLFIMLEKGGIVPFNEFHKTLTFNQASNFQKLKYWGLVTKLKDEDGKREGGFWALTDLGKKFLLGKSAVFKSVWTYRNEFVRPEGDSVFVTDLGYEPYRRQGDYIDDEIPRYISDDGQVSLFGEES